MTSNGAGPSARAGRPRLAVASRLLVWVVGEPIALAAVTGTFVSVASGTMIPFTSIEGVVATLTIITVGAVLVTRLPGHLVGWMLWIGGFMGAVSLGATNLATEGLVTHPGSLPGATWFAWLGILTGAPGLLISTLLVPFVFPTGHLPSARWRPIAIFACAAILVGMVASAFGPFAAGTFPIGVENPLGIGGRMGDLLAGLHTATTVGFVAVCFPFAIAAIVGRFGRATGIEREQLRWYSTVAAIIIVALAMASLGVGAGAWTIAVGGLALMPVAIGIAVLRYRLYDLDIVIRRTLVYVPLTALLAGTYAASIGLFQRLFIAFTGNRSDGAVILSTLILAATFTPIKNALQLRVDRTFRDSQDLERVLLAFTESVAVALAADPARTLRAFLRVAVGATGARGGGTFMRTSRGERAVGETAARRAAPVLVVRVEGGGRYVGRLELDGRSDGRPYDDRALAALQAAGQRLGIALVGSATAPTSVEVRAAASPTAEMPDITD